MNVLDHLIEEHRKAEQLIATLSRIFTVLLPATDDGGDILKFAGDALFVLFRGEEHAKHAAHAAWNMNRVLAAIERLGLDVERRDIYATPAYRHELVAARGRGTVPVLRITSPDGSDRWMPESRDIVRYLERLREKRAA